MIGEKIRQFEILAEIGAGGFGKVFRARDSRLHREVALKLIREDIAADEKVFDRFVREARALSAVNHPNVVTIHEINEYKGRHYICMEYVEGVTLEERLREGPLTTAEFLDLAKALFLALHAVQEAGLVHRDIKPSNIMIGSDGTLKLMDFGIACARSVENITEEGIVSGTLGYMSPEQLRGEELDVRSDFFSAGVVLYEALAGIPPFRGETDSASIHATLYTDPPGFTQVEIPSEDIPASLEKFIFELLRKKREKRPDRSAALLEKLETTMRELDPESRPSRRVPLLLGALLLLGAGAAWWFWPTSLEVEVGVFKIDSTEDERNIALAPGDLVRRGDRVYLRFRNERDFHLYVFFQDSKDQWFALHPEPDTEGSSSVAGGEDFRLPPNEGFYSVDENPGQERFWILASADPVQELEAQVRALPALRRGDEPGTISPETGETLVAKLHAPISSRTVTRGLLFVPDPVEAEGKAKESSSIPASNGKNSTEASPAKNGEAKRTPGLFKGLYSGSLVGKDRVSMMFYLDHQE